jgi:hypothetical protein
MFLQMFSQVWLRSGVARLRMGILAGTRTCVSSLKILRKVGMPHLTDTDRQALRLADELQRAIQQWLSHQGVDPSCTVSPFVDGAGQPAVLMKLTAQAAWALMDGLHRQPGPVPRGARPAPGGAAPGPAGAPGQA